MDRRRFLACIAGLGAALPAELRAFGTPHEALRPRQRGRVRFGCCTNQLATDSDATGIESIRTLARLGFDFVELPLAPLTTLDASGFEAIERRIKASGIPCEACGNFLPPAVKVTGPDVEPQRLADYVEPALERAARLGAKIVVCGSPGSRNLPSGFPVERAWEQMADFLRSTDRVAGAHGIIIALEAISRPECNFLNRAADSLRLAMQVNRPNVKLVVDYYHLAMEKEGPDVLSAGADFIRHVHIGSAGLRAFPKRTDPDDYRGFVDALKRINYSRRISIEARTTDLTKDGAESLALLRGLLG
jgi:D-psicose/D-tagatose/L-ribulose 3-epimerase